MSLLKYLERVQRMDDLIHRRATGNAEAFARKLGISRSLVLEHLRDLRDLGAPIKFSEERQTYYYEGDFSFTLSTSQRRSHAG